LSLPVSHGLVSLAVSVLGFLGGSILMGLFLSLTAGRSPRKQWKAIVLYPIYLASWYPLHFWALFSKPKDWKPIVHGTAVDRQKTEAKVNERVG